MHAKVADKIATGILYVVAFLFITLLVSLFSYILFQGVPYISLDFLTSPSSTVQAGGGIRDQLFNSFYILFITMIITVPLGVCGGIYMAEYAKPGKVTNAIRTCIEMLASLPSIVVGMFGLLIFVNTTGWGYTIIGGALALTIFNIPVMVRVSEDAVRSVPQDQKEASLALGITKWHTIKTVILPAAFPGILTGAILASGRIFGEAAALLFTAGLSTPNLDYGNWNPFSASSPLNIFRPAETLAVHIWAVNTNGIMPDVQEIAAGSSAVLVLSVLLFNIIARVTGKRIQKKLTASK
ncbi:phosphate ABC transporter permease PstA [Virgibacillus dakarensis]|uniref:Phosphate transport system permease protein PstA n=1 Tax=Lentibacillus populi TaxID=1827502 RepID=A0A9W5X3W3_9BACI|nr:MULTISPECIES: phosphate ABC transporter permease PstA [Bacillaceae]MBT2214469.1 phosphate ABC transporter permease PstA [Virgibacillus dakarensis]MTW84073.1 phosphate ABC transporter permease PstA [Virgibacillus dakarensis]GGB29258.1 putative ABC transporter permease protein YqgI [Lentibacillus populi]